MGQVILNGNPITITGRVTERAVNPWAARVTQGPKEFGSYNVCETRLWNDFRGGLGVESEYSASDRYWYGYSLEPSISSYMCLSYLTTAATSAAQNYANKLYCDFEGVTYCHANSASLYDTGTDFAAADASPLATPSDCITVKDGTDNYMVVCNGSNARYCSVGYGGSKDWAVLTTSDIKYMCVFDKRLCAVDGTGTTLFSSAQNNIDDSAGGIMTNSFTMTGIWSTVYDLYTGLLPTSNEEVIFMVTDVGLVAIDYFTRSTLILDVRYSKPPSGVNLCGMYYNGDVYVSYGAGIKKLAASGMVTEWGPNQDDGIFTTYQGYIQDMVSTLDWIYILVAPVSSGYNVLMKRHCTVGGWHIVSVLATTGKYSKIHYSNINTPARIYFSLDGNDKIYYIPHLDMTSNVRQISGQSYAASGVVTLPIFKPVEIIPKIALSVEAITLSCTATELITVGYRLNNSTASFTSLGTFATSPYPTALSFATSVGVAFYTIQFQLTFARGSTATLSPVLCSLLFKYLINPTYIGQWSFNLATDGIDTKRIYDQLTTARDSTTLIKFCPTGNSADGEYYVKVNQMPSLYDAVFPSPDKKLTVVVSEVS